MDQENIDYLKKQLLNLGFGEKLNEGLDTTIKQQPQTFQLSQQREFKNGAGSANVDFELNFKKSEKNGKYYFNSFKATLQSDNPEKVTMNTFYTADGITAKEAFNLLEGRAVNKNLVGKDDVKFNAWRQLDFDIPRNKYGNIEFKQWHENYGYDLEKVLNKFPIKELTSDDSKAKVMYSLQKGNLTEVAFLSEGSEQRMYISANPKPRTINVYDENMRPLYQGNTKEKTAEPEKKARKKEAVSAGETQEEKPGKRAGKRVKI